MKKPLHSRPNLEHLRSQAKALLASLPKDNAAAQTLIDHLPAAAGMSIAKVRATPFRLADAQFAIARKEGFASWPKLATHVSQLRAMEGTWDFAALEMDGAPMAPYAYSRSQLLIDGDRFCMLSPEADYEGVFLIDVEAKPHTIDIQFIAGPEAGNTSYGIYELNGDQLRICLGLTGVPRPTAFKTTQGSGHALEVLTRSSKARPASVTISTGQKAPQPAADAGDLSRFEYQPGPDYEKLQGSWRAVEAILDGNAMPAAMVASGKRIGVRNEVKVSFGGGVMLDAKLYIDSTRTPMEIDYLHQAGSSKGRVQKGIMEWIGEDVRFCMAAAGQERPGEFGCGAGSGRTVTRWQRE